MTTHPQLQETSRRQRPHTSEGGMVDEPKKYILDSFALLAYFGNEPGAETVEQLLR